MVQRDVVPVGVAHLREEGHLLLNLGDIVIWGVEVDDL